VSATRTDQLFSEFSPVSKSDWAELIRNDLNGADYREKLMWDTMEGITVAPFYTKDDFLKKEYTPSHIQTSNWLCCELVTGSSISKANESLGKALDGGADACLIQSRITVDPDQNQINISGVPVQSRADMEQLIEGTGHKAELIFDCGMASAAMVSMLSSFGNHLFQCSAVFDPLTETAKTGYFPVPEQEMKKIIQDLCVHAGPNILCANGAFYHNAGATIIQELGITLAIGSEYLAITDENSASSTANNMFLKLGTGPLFFPEIAKYRAIRVLWAQMLHAYGIKNHKPLRIFAETGKTNKTISDPHNNLLRSVTEAMSAIIGGADMMMAYPFDSASGETDLFSLRIARNIQHILKEEAHFNKTDDPSSGSYYIEILTDKIARESWKYFQNIEKQGGFLRALKNGFIQQEILASAKTRENEYATGRRVLTGTNQYPNPSEKLRAEESITTTVALNAKPDIARKEKADGFKFLNYKNAFASGAMLGDLLGGLITPDKEKFSSIQPFRAGKAFDAIKLRTQDQITKYGRRPYVMLILVGNERWRTARAQFARNVFECAGFEVNSSAGFTKKENGAADIYVLCSSDDGYEKFTDKFKGHFSGKGILVLAGKPAGKEDQYKEMGIDEFIFKGMNLPAFLNKMQDKLYTSEAG
jgi:methylmalonyl-CoA mutase